MIKVNNKDTRTTSIVNFEQVNAGWEWFFVQPNSKSNKRNHIAQLVTKDF